MRLDGKVALITGAGSGMGRVAALMFAREGARVVAADLDERAGQETEALARQEGLEVRFTRADVSREADCRAMVALAEEAFGKLDVLYNNAGIFPEADHSVIDTEEAVWDRVLAVNVKGVYLACKYGIPAMQRAGGGSIVNIASFVALVGCSVPHHLYAQRAWGGGLEFGLFGQPATGPVVLALGLGVAPFVLPSLAPTPCVILPTPDFLFVLPSNGLQLPLPPSVRPVTFWAQAVPILPTGFEATGVWRIQAN